MDIIQNIDTRSLSSDELYALRVRFINAYITCEKNKTKLSKLFHIDYKTALSWIQLYLSHGWEGLKVKVRGRKKEKHRYITKSIMDEIEDIILNKLPKDYKLPGTVWSSRIITRLVKEKYDIKITPRGMRLYLNERGLSFLKDVPKEKRTK
jgi:transposase